MAITVIEPEKLGSAELAISPTLTTLRTTPSNSKDMIKDIMIANNGVSIAIVNLYLVPIGDSAGSGNILLPGIVLKENTVFQWEGLQVLDSGGTIEANSNISGVAVHVSGGNAI